MKWIYIVRHKLIAALLLSVLLGLILWNNLNESNSMKKLEASFTSMYEDRLMVESYIFHLSENLHKKAQLLGNAKHSKIPLHTNDSLLFIQNNIANLLTAYEQTKLTKKEARLFKNLKETIHRINLEKQELIAFAEKPAKFTATQIAIQQNINKAQHLLSGLSDIQVNEGRNINEASKAVLLGSSSSSQFENALLIIVALIIQTLIFTSKTTLKEINQKYWLN
ncbi:MAG: MCP four helix bundle domain-containing protein [Chitinophagales bacterium]